MDIHEDINRFHSLLKFTGRLAKLLSLYSYTFSAHTENHEEGNGKRRGTSRYHTIHGPRYPTQSRKKEQSISTKP